MSDPLIAAIEAGGTKFVASLASGPDDIRVRKRIPTTKPDETIPKLLEFFRDAIAEHGQPEAIGIGTFGPVDLQKDSPTFGHITSTPKLAWQNADLLGPIQAALDLPAFIDTDVNAAALGEWQWGAGQGIDNLIYITIGTGIGGGILINGAPVHGLLHPEIGHIRIPRPASEIEAFAGVCPFHGDCFEGIAAGPAIEARWGKPAQELGEDHEAWDIQAGYVAQACVNFTLTVSCQRIILGGGVNSQMHLFPKIRERFQLLLNNYLVHSAVMEVIDQFIVPPGLGDNAGLLGSVALAQQFLRK
ncbi:MAG: ROK family protein [Verrucomicrobiota bacterium]